MGTLARPTPEQVAHAVAGYQSGKSTYTLGAEMGRSGSWVATVLHQAGVTMRPKGARHGHLNVRWTDNPGYFTAHQRVAKARGKASHCVECGVNDDRQYHWANLTGNYADVMDYQSMCVPCHRRLDYQSPPRMDWES